MSFRVEMLYKKWNKIGPHLYSFMLTNLHKCCIMMTVRTKERRWNRLSATKAKRYRLTVPDADVSTQQWLASQINFSNSIRALIREDIMKNGFTDVSCRPVEQGLKRGRPSNAELERREQVTQTETIQGEPEVAIESIQRASSVSPIQSTQTIPPTAPSAPQASYGTPVTPQPSMPQVSESAATTEEPDPKDDVLASLML